MQHFEYRFIIFHGRYFGAPDFCLDARCVRAGTRPVAKRLITDASWFGIVCPRHKPSLWILNIVARTRIKTAGGGRNRQMRLTTTRRSVVTATRQTREMQIDGRAARGSRNQWSVLRICPRGSPGDVRASRRHAAQLDGFLMRTPSHPPTGDTVTWYAPRWHGYGGALRYVAGIGSWHD